jgi:hypothetical protein
MIIADKEFISNFLNILYKTINIKNLKKNSNIKNE